MLWVVLTSFDRAFLIVPRPMRASMLSAALSVPVWRWPTTTESD